jgi:hypothetical protein
VYFSRYENQYKLHIVVHQEGKFVCSQCGKQLITKRYLIQVGKYCAFIYIGPPGGEVCVQPVWQTANHQALSNSGMEVLYCTFIHRGSTLDVA